jgi:hypothetical protein
MNWRRSSWFLSCERPRCTTLAVEWSKWRQGWRVKRCIRPMSRANDAQGKGRICEFSAGLWGAMGDRKHLGLHVKDFEIAVVGDFHAATVADGHWTLGNGQWTGGAFIAHGCSAKLCYALLACCCLSLSHSGTPLVETCRKSACSWRAHLAGLPVTFQRVQTVQT